MMSRGRIVEVPWPMTAPDRVVGNEGAELVQDGADGRITDALSPPRPLRRPEAAQHRVAHQLEKRLAKVVLGQDADELEDRLGSVVG